METVREFGGGAIGRAVDGRRRDSRASRKVEPRRFVPLSAAEAVLRYWSDFIPSWAGAMSIDLLPVVLVLVLMIVHDAMRREANNLEDAETMTAAEMMRAMELYRQMTSQPLIVPEPVAPPEAAEAAVAAVAEAAAEKASPPVAVAPDATVTPIELGQRKRGDGPSRT